MDFKGSGEASVPQNGIKYAKITTPNRDKIKLSKPIFFRNLLIVFNGLEFLINYKHKVLNIMKELISKLIHLE